MNIVIICVGGKHEPKIAEFVEDYTKRLKKYYALEWKTLPHQKAEPEIIRHKESDEIIAKLDPTDVVWLLDETGNQITSLDLAEKLEQKKQTKNRLVIIIGGAYGVDERLKKRANFVWSLSKLVFPHQLCRLILIEQLYRANSINLGTKYHHE